VDRWTILPSGESKDTNPPPLVRPGSDQGWWVRRDEVFTGFLIAIIAHSVRGGAQTEIMPVTRSLGVRLSGLRAADSAFCGSWVSGPEDLDAHDEQRQGRCWGHIAWVRARACTPDPAPSIRMIPPRSSAAPSNLISRQRARTGIIPAGLEAKMVPPPPRVGGFVRLETRARFGKMLVCSLYAKCETGPVGREGA
jgi:hypothetical protein